MRAYFKIFLALASVLFLSVPTTVHADVNNFTVTNFSADYYLDSSDPQGALRIEEQLTVDFSDNNHGILRALPQKYNGQDQHLKVTSVKRANTPEPYTTYTSDGNLVLRIGSPNRIMTGVHTYEITYSAQNVIRFTSAHDQLIWNTNGTQWQQPFLAETARLHIPTSLADKLTTTECFTGAQGSTIQNCTVDQQDQITTFTTTQALNAGETMTFVAAFPVGTFEKPTRIDWVKEHLLMMLAVAIPPLLAFAVVYPYWRKNGKDLKGRGTIIPEYTPPNDLHAAEADVIMHYNLRNTGVSATVIDLAIRKYLRITQQETAGVLGIGKHKTYTFNRLPKPVGDTMLPYEREVLNGLFPNGDTTKLDDLKKQFYAVVASIGGSLPTKLTDDGYFPQKVKQAMGVLVTIAIFLSIGGFAVISFSIALGLGLFAAAIICGTFARIMPKRTEKGVMAKESLEGLKLYMNTAEKDRLAMLQGAGARYAPQADVPVHTVELFEKLLPFAIVLGVEGSWAKQFEGIYTTPPDWYNANWATFNAAYLVGSLNEGMSAMNTSFAAPSSGNSGSGGSFSGGGGGGGGGGGW